MGTIRRGHQNRRDVLRVLIEFGLSDKDIVQALEVSRDTVKADRHALNIIYQKRPQRGGDFTRLVFAYVELRVNNCIRGRELNRKTLKVLMRGLEIRLRVSDVRATLRGAHATLSARLLQDIRFQGCLDLASTVFTEVRKPQDPRIFFEYHLLRLYRDELSLPHSPSAFCDQALSAYLATEAILAKPHPTKKGAELGFLLVEEALATLPPEQGEVLRLRFGLTGSKRKTFKAIEKALGRNHEIVRQDEVKGVRTLKHPSRSRLLRGLAISSSQLFEEYLEETLRAKQKIDAEKLTE